MPEWFFIGVVCGYGLIIGSFLNVVIYRFHTGRSLSGHSHCLSCGRRLRWFELVPVVSYLVLLGRCRSCRSLIPIRYALVELVTAGAFVVAYLHTTSLVLLGLLLVFLSLLIVVAVYDLYHLIIPDSLSAALAVVALLAAGYEALLAHDWSIVGLAVLAGAIAALFFAGLWWMSSGRWLGFGDAKLAFPLAAMTGLSGVFSLVVWSFWVGAIVSLAIIAVQALGLHKRFGFGGTARVKMKSEIPFAPFLIIAFVLVYFFDADVLALVERAMLAVL